MKTIQELEQEFKECITCKIYKRFSEFSPRKLATDGLYGSCKDCTNQKHRISHEKQSSNPDWYAKDLERNRLYMQSRRTEYYNPKRQSNYRKENPDKNRAHALLNYHVKHGNIVKMPCQICGKEKVDGHHEDYSKPKEVIWLCRTHHREIHRKFNTIRQQLGIPEHDRQL